MWRIQWWKSLEINRFLITILISPFFNYYFNLFYIFCTTISTPFIFIVTANFYCLQIDSKHRSTNFTIGFIGRRLEIIWPQLYYHLFSVRQVYFGIIFNLTAKQQLSVNFAPHLRKIKMSIYNFIIQFQFNYNPIFNIGNSVFLFLCLFSKYYNFNSILIF